ncbi:MAG: hypothetical protein PHZ04_04385 [Patescibacteria group bacterium]|nr:hypothetical protein [Patescibacteria group bacterium]MDD5294644.1 hypothetical protein [Patescibacteria group bacterium]MDD5554500.1 hypothetical protein [Patescibacteria group bacterium]
MAKRIKKSRLEARVKITPGTGKNAKEGKQKIGSAEKLPELREIKVDKESKKIILPSQEEKIERDKKLMMWAGVSFFMVLISAFWILNIKSIFKETKEARDNPQKFEWEKITNEFGQTIEQIKEGLTELKQAAVTDNISTTTEDNANINNFLPTAEDIGSSSPAGTGSEETLGELKDRLKELEGEIESKN